MNRAAAILVLILLAAFGASPRALAKVCIREKTASGDFSSRHALHARTSAPRVAESQWVGGGAATNFASDRSIGLNWYAYASGNPISFADPTGFGSINATAAMNRNTTSLGINSDYPRPIPGPAPTPAPLTPERIRQQIVGNALNAVGSQAWNLDAFKFPLRPGQYKCNLFVADTLAASGASTGNAPGRFTPYSASEWADSTVEIPKWPLTQQPQAGDVISNGIHMGIITGSQLTTSATANGVVENDWGFRGKQRNIIYRTYENR